MYSVQIQPKLHLSIFFKQIRFFAQADHIYILLYIFLIV